MSFLSERKAPNKSQSSYANASENRQKIVSEHEVKTAKKVSFKIIAKYKAPVNTNITGALSTGIDPPIPLKEGSYPV